MAENNITARIIIRQATSTEWAASTATTLKRGEFALDTTTGVLKIATADKQTFANAKIISLNGHTHNNYVTTDTAQTISGIKTFNAPAQASGEQATTTFKTANGGQLIIGKEGPNSGTMLAFDQTAGTRRLNFRATSTPGAMVWSQPESDSSLYYDVNNIYFRTVTGINFSNFKNGLLKVNASGTLSVDNSAYLTAHQKVTLESGTNNGTLKLTVGSTETNNIAVKGLAAAAYKGVSTSVSTSADLVTSNAVKTYVDGKVAGKVQYLGTVTSEATLNALTPANKGDFARASANFKLTDGTEIHSSDMLICEDVTKKTWSIIHGEIDANTWVANSKIAAGYVAAGGSNANKVWKTDANGNPAWRDDANTDTGVTSVTTSGNGNAITGASISGRTLTLTKNNSFLSLSGGTLSGVIKGGAIDIHPENDGTIIGYYTNDLAFLTQRGGSYTMKNKTTNTVIADSASSNTATNMFDGSPSYFNYSVAAVTNVIEIVIKSPTTYSYTTQCGIGFGASNWRAKDIKIEFGYSATNKGTAQNPDSDIVWKTRINQTNQGNGLVYGAGGGPNANEGGVSSSAWSYIRLTLTNFNSTGPRIAQIFTINYGSKGMHSTFLGLGGGTLYGGLNVKGTLYENGTSLTSKYLGINSKAADSAKLGGVEASKYATQTWVSDSYVPLSMLGNAAAWDVTETVTDADNVLPSSAAVKSFVEGKGYTTNKGTVTSVAVKMNGTTKGTITGSGTIDLGTVITAHQSLDGYATQTWVTNKGYTTNTGTITGIKMNGASKGTSGVVDLGTVLTSHQDISGKANLSGATFTGEVVLKADPTKSLGAATKQYVDNKLGSAILWYNDTPPSANGQLIISGPAGSIQSAGTMVIFDCGTSTKNITD